MTDKNNSTQHECPVPSLQEIVDERVEACWYAPYSENADRTPNEIKNEEQPNGRNEYAFFPETTSVGEYFFNPADAGSGRKQVHTSAEGAQTVVCQLCPKRCKISDGRVGFCSARINRGGRLYSRFYGRPTSVAIDPIEKKPLFHFLPGSPILSLGTQGCNLSCKFCQNWQISRPFSVSENLNRVLTPEKVVQIAIENRCPSVAFTYNEPTVWCEYVVHVARLCRESGIKTAVVTNGMISGEARKELYGIVDAANVDLKAFTSGFYKNYTNGSLEDVQETLEFIAKQTNVWLEVTNLLIPTLNDSPNEIQRMCEWIVNTLGPHTPIHFSAFFPTYRLLNLPPTPAQTVIRAVEIAKKTGLEYAYGGNIQDEASLSTFCPNCGETLIERSRRYETKIMAALTEKSETEWICGKCGRKIFGVFK